MTKCRILPYISSRLAPDFPVGALGTTYFVETHFQLQGFIRSFVSWVSRSILGDKLFTRFLNAAHSKPFNEIMEWTVKRNEFNDRFYEEVSFAILRTTFHTHCFILGMEQAGFRWDHSPCSASCSATDGVSLLQECILRFLTFIALVPS